MDMQMLRDQIWLEQPLGRTETTAIVEGEVTLPGGLREEARVLLADCTPVVEGCEAMQDRASIGGRAIFRVLYTQGDATRVQVMETTADFTHMCDFPGCQGKAVVTATPHVEHVNARTAGGRLMLRAEIGLDVQAVSAAPVEALTGFDGSDDVELQLSEKEIRRTVARGNREVLLREELEIPSGADIRETLFGTARATVNEVTGGMGRAGMNGMVELEAVHAAAREDQPLLVTRHSFPFQQMVELSGEDGELLEGCATVKDVAVVSQASDDGTRILRAEVLLALEGRADRKETVSVVSDAYTTSGDDLRLTRRTIRCRAEDNCVQTAESGRVTLLLPDSAPPVRRVLAAFVTPSAVTFTQTGSRMTAEGKLDTTLLYMTDDSAAPVSVHQSEPFRATFTVPPDMDAAPVLTASQAEALPVTSDRVELRYILHLSADAWQDTQLTIVTEVQPVAAGPMTEDIVLCFVQPGETLWDVARRYRVPLDALRELNPGVSDEPQEGDGILVWRREIINV